MENCITSGEFTEEQCRQLEDEAMRNHLNSVPRYRSQQECIAEFGPNQCEQRQTAFGGGVWMPLMLGFLAGRALDGHSNRYQSSALYSSRSDPNALRTSRNYRVDRNYGGKAKLPTWASTPSYSRDQTSFGTRSRTQAVSRGGFGRRSSGWGG
jgi:uncharacterized protein YgiB involved in biofilm formation